MVTVCVYSTSVTLAFGQDIDGFYTIINIATTNVILSYYTPLNFEFRFPGELTFNAKVALQEMPKHYWHHLVCTPGPQKIPAPHHPMPYLGPCISGAPFVHPPGRFPIPGPRFFQGTVWCPAFSQQFCIGNKIFWRISSS